MTLHEYLSHDKPETLWTLLPGSVIVGEEDWDIIIDQMNTEKEFFVTVKPINNIFRESCYFRKANGILHTVKNGMPHEKTVFRIHLA